MIKVTGLTVFMLLLVFKLIGSNNASAQEPTFGPICDNVTVTCPPSPSPTATPTNPPRPTPTNTPTNTPTVYPTATPVITSIPPTGMGGPMVGLLLLGGTLILAGHFSLLRTSKS